MGASLNGWETAEVPTSNTLYGVSHTVNGPYAVGGGGDVITRDAVGNWTFALEYGPSGESNPLRAVDVTSERERIWFAGGSGIVGEYDVVTGTLTDYSAPKGKTSTWEDVAVEGKSGSNEHVYLVNGSGEELSDQRDSSGQIVWDDVTKPGGGSTIPAVDFYEQSHGHCCDTSGGVYKAKSSGNKWEKIGIDGTEVNFYDIASVEKKDVNVAGASGTIYRYDGSRWSPTIVGQSSVRGIDRDLELAELLVTHITQALKRVQFEEELRNEIDRFAALFDNVPSRP
ncbi:hypothetical protein [Haladaptatus sp. NG-SE-30]